MDPIEVQLRVLSECLKKKEKALKQIESITENQGVLLTNDLPEEEMRTFFVQMNTEKQAFIKTVLQCDQVFENILKQIGPELDKNQSMYREEVLELQEGIRRVVDLDVSIRVLEENNNNSVGKRNIRVNPPAVNKPGVPPTIDSGAYGAEKLRKEYESQSRNLKG